eukprot:TRINITY_DN45466_c0_g1_i1.p1 TRINITY_DN45466_c0_g1~~TRINITY_DN45466_c0_g1_i1.p1  ORF type:complete len:415 (-),score=77.36 TRINITY_DN45466_c0_g1_i1:33-1277(-)
MELLALHVLADDVCRSPSGAEAIGVAVSRALVGLDVSRKTHLAARLRDAVHASIAEAGSCPAARECWASALAAAAGCGSSVRASTAQLPRSAGIAWSLVLRYAVSLEALAGGLQAVSRTFRHLTQQSTTWADHVVTLRQSHLSGLNLRGEHHGWGKAFTMLTVLKQAHALRIDAFPDGAFRARVLPPLRRACLELCPRVELISCSFCERHRGDLIDLPTPRRLTARRRPEARRGGGLLLGSGPLESRSSRGRSEGKRKALNAAASSAADQAGDRGFDLLVKQLLPGERLDIGVTTLAPCEQFREESCRDRRILFAEDLRSSWVVESSGLLVGSHAGLRVRDPGWNARHLCTGDVVQLRVLNTGELVLSVNGARRAAWRAQIPSDAPIYPVVDLFEGAPSVRLITEPLPLDGLDY